MKKFVIAAVLAVIGVGTAFALTNDSDTLKVSANITTVLDVEAVAGSAITLTSGANNLQAGTVTVLSNRKNWTITLSSANTYDTSKKGALRGYNGETGTELYIPYKFTLSGTLYGNSVTLFATSLGDWQPTELTKDLTSRSTPGSNPDSFSAVIAVGSEDANWNAAYTYEDTLTLTVSAD